jgi:alkaline phosphatase
MLPVFAYGPGAKHFIGTYQNYEVAGKIMELLQLK